MDLRAFIGPGVHPVFLQGDSCQQEPWGHVLSRPNRPLSWLVRDCPSPGSQIAISLSLPDFSLDPDGSLCPKSGALARVVLLGLIKKSRPLEGAHVLKFTSLMRVLD
ncbi:MAG: hypothetical protein LBE31_11005 [Deltaproteobacteria bacterium]|jgi:hypothetical protein|nr:hypothetical protein [Deltaproteobacteria bacterium]